MIDTIKWMPDQVSVAVFEVFEEKIHFSMGDGYEYICAADTPRYAVILFCEDLNEEVLGSCIMDRNIVSKHGAENLKIMYQGLWDKKRLFPRQVLGSRMLSLVEQ